MIPFRITFLGTGAGLPTLQRGVSSLVIQINREYLMIDCGEGTQIQMQRFGIKSGHINHIFISHLHGDHFFGLPGLLFTYHLFSRQKPLHIYGPDNLENSLKAIMHVEWSVLSYQLHFHTISSDEPLVILEGRDFKMSCFPLKHRIASYGFKIVEKESPFYKLRKEALNKWKPDIKAIKSLCLGEDFVTSEGEVIPNEVFSFPKAPPRSFAYLSDTSYLPELKSIIHEVSVLYHEATYLKGEEENAFLKGHSTDLQAAELAKAANVKKLLLGHISPKIIDPQILIENTQSTFHDTFVVYDGFSLEI